MRKIISMPYKQIPRLDGNATPSFCRDDCVSTYATFVGKQYQTMYMSAMLNYYKPNSEKSIGESIYSDMNIEKCMREYVGVAFEQIESDDIIQAIIDQINQGKPVQVAVDGFYCPWDWRYQLFEDSGHSMFVVGYDLDTKHFICVDPYYEKQDTEISFEEYLCAHQGIFVPKVVMTGAIDVESVLKDRAKLAASDEYLGSMKQLPQAIRDGFVLEKEVEGYDEEDFSMEENQDNIHLNKAMKNIVHDRLRYSLLLRYVATVAKNQDKYLNLADECAFIAKKWNMARMMLLKCLFARKTERFADGLANKIDEIIDAELEMLNKVFSDDYVDDQESTTTSSYTTYNTIDISDLFNNKGIGKDADLNNNGEFFINYDFVPMDNVKYNLSQFDLKQMDLAFDNISCAGQTIHIDDKINGLLFLGCSEWGDFTDDVTVYYADGIKEKVRFTLNDWVPDFDKEDRTKMVCSGCKTVVIETGEIVDEEDAYLYYADIKLAGKTVRDIVLPQCENMHIFAITKAV